MALNNLSSANIAVVVNGRLITGWGETDPALTIDPIDPKSTLRRGQGGSAVRLDRINPGRAITLNLNPSHPDSAFMMALMNANENVTLGVTVVGTGEKGIYTEGAIVNVGQYGRVGQSITDDSYEMEFNVSEETRG